ILQQLWGAPYPSVPGPSPLIEVNVSPNVSTTRASAWSEIAGEFWSCVDFVAPVQIYKVVGSQVTQFSLPTSQYSVGAVITLGDGQKYAACVVQNQADRWIKKDPDPATTFSDFEFISIPGAN